MLKGEKVVSLQDGETETGTEYIGRASIQTDGSRARLTLSGLRETDHGWYECRLFFPNRTPTTRLNGTWYHLTVHGNAITEFYGNSLYKYVKNISTKYLDLSHIIVLWPFVHTMLNNITVIQVDLGT